MDWINLLYAISAAASALTAVLAWAAKLRWSKEYGAAKDETIKAKEAQIEALKTQIIILQELTPMKLREYFTSVKEQLEEYNNALQKQVEEKKQEIKQLESEGKQHKTELDKVRQEKQTLEAKINQNRTISRQLPKTTLGNILTPHIAELINQITLSEESKTPTNVAKQAASKNKE